MGVPIIPLKFFIIAGGQLHPQFGGKGKGVCKGKPIPSVKAEIPDPALAIRSGLLTYIGKVKPHKEPEKGRGVFKIEIDKGISNIFS
jgi:hypothetical protein